MGGDIFKLEIVLYSKTIRIILEKFHLISIHHLGHVRICERNEMETKMQFLQHINL